MVYDSGNLRDLSVAYANQISGLAPSKKARKAARQKLQTDGEGSGPDPFGLSKKRRRIRPSDPAQNNPNDIGQVIIPQGQGPM